MPSTSDGELLFKISDKLIGNPSRMIHSNDGRRLIVSSKENIVIVDLANRKVLDSWKADDQPGKFAVSNDGKKLAVGCRSGKVKIWDLETQSLLQTLDVGQVVIWGVAFNSDDSLLAAVIPQKSVEIWDVANGKKVTSYKTYFAAAGIDLLFLPGSNVLAVQAGPDYEQFPQDEYRNAIWLIDAVTGKNIKALKGHVHSVSALRYLSQQMKLVSASAEGMIKFWDVDPATLK